MNAEVQEKINAEDERLREVYELSLLFDFYGELLGEHKKQIFEDYVLNDYSLAEVAGEAGISRQGVHDIIKRCTRSLKEYEEKLHLVEKFEQTKKLVGDIKEISEEIRRSGDVCELEKITMISEQILNEI